MTRDEWIKRYIARMLHGGSSRTEDELISLAEVACNATEDMGHQNPDEWEEPEVIADEHLEYDD